jgi:hypothetical protein
MQKRQLLPLATWAIIILTIVISISTPLWQSVPLWSIEAFRLSFLGNWAATMIGALVGIPISLILERWWQSEREHIEQKRSAKAQAAREAFVLNAIRDELQMNRDIIHQMLDEQEKRPTIVPTKGMKDVSWRALSDSGELKWIDDLRVLLSISEAYFHIGALIYLERQYVDISSRENLMLNPGQDIAVRRVHMIRPDALMRVKEAIKIIDLKIGSDIVHSDGTSGLPKMFEP